MIYTVCYLEALLVRDFLTEESIIQFLKYWLLDLGKILSDIEDLTIELAGLSLEKWDFEYYFSNLDSFENLLIKVFFFR